MEHCARIDVALKDSGVCVVDAAGRIVREAKVASEPEALAAWFRGLGIEAARVGLEAGPLSQWLHAGLGEAGFEAVLLETRHVKAALSAMVVKTDRKDARGIAQLLRMGWFRPVHRNPMACGVGWGAAQSGPGGLRVAGPGQVARRRPVQIMLCASACRRCGRMRFSRSGA
jgi:hypothetical protein